MGGAAGLAAWLSLAAEREAVAALTAGTGGLGVLLLAAGLLLRLAVAVPLAVALLGAGYALLLVAEGGELDLRAPLVAAALYAVADTGYWTLELRAAVADEAGMYLRRAGQLATASVAVVAGGIALLALAEAIGRGGPALELLGAAAAVGAVALLALASRDASSRAG